MVITHLVLGTIKGHSKICSFVTKHNATPNFVVSNCLVATILSHCYNSRTSSGERKVESHATLGSPIYS